MRDVLLVFPTGWDAKQLDAVAARWRDRFRVRFAGPDSDAVPYDFDVLGFIDAAAIAHRGHVRGVVSSSDYPGATAAAALSRALDLPGSPASAVLGCSHKYVSRLLQREVVPEATPRFTLVDSAAPEAAAEEIEYPVFVKPVKGAYSVLSRRVDSAAELVEFLSKEAVAEFTGEYMKVFDQLLARYTDAGVGGRYFLAEELLSGRQVTVEGYCAGGETEVVGIVDSHLDGGSFVGFVYPSELPAPVQERMADVARRLLAASGIEWGMWNVEMIHDPATDRVAIVEVNPRMCGQFADLYAKVDGPGAHGYELALALAVGERPRPPRREGRHAFAASFPLRTFERVEVRRCPAAADVAAAEALHPATLVWVECEKGWKLADFDRYEDGHSVRYGVLNLGAPTRAALDTRRDEVLARLGFDFAPLG